MPASNEASGLEASAVKMIDTLQVGRGIAALGVVVAHASIATNAFSGEIPEPLSSVLLRGYLGVDFFFVLSGFIIYTTSYNMLRFRRRWQDYLRKRLVRIYVPYLPIGVVLAALYMILPNLTSGDREWSWFPTLTLLPYKLAPALSVAWTLQHEVLFYALFMGFALTIGVLWGFIGWLGLIGAFALVVGEVPREWAPFLAPINAEFGFGVLAAWLYSRDSTGSDRWYWAGCVASMAAYVALGGAVSHRIFFGAAVAFAIVPLCRREAKGMLSFAPALVFLGAASYAIYLVHNPVLSVTARLLKADWPIHLIALTMVGAVAGIFYHLVFERLAIRWVNSWLSTGARDR